MATYNETAVGGAELWGLAVLVGKKHYDYTISTDITSGLYDSDRMAKDIADSSVVIASDYLERTGDALTIWMKDQLSSGDETALDAVVMAHTGDPIEIIESVNLNNVAETTDNFLRVVEEPREGDAKNFYGPNMCDRTTWYEGCTMVDEFELTDSGDLTTWNTNATHPGPWIDLYHGKLMFENAVLAASPDCAFKIEVDAGGVGTWVEKTMDTFDDADNDYNVDFANGTVTFNTALTSGDKVRASFCKSPSTMLWTMAPDTGKRLKLMYAEIQVTTDIVITADIVYETWAYNPADLPNKIKIGEIRYKTLSDFLYESTGAYPAIPAFGGTGPRGIGNKEVIILPFNYSTARDIRASQGVEVRIKTTKIHTGTMGTSTLYCLQEDE